MEDMMIQSGRERKKNLPVLYFALYINVDGQSPQCAREGIYNLVANFNRSVEETDFNEKFFVFPVKNQPSKIELLYPFPGVDKAELDEMYEKHLKRLDDLRKRIEDE
jgi:hypothetical protein